jgi:hypothetical protein
MLKTCTVGLGRAPLVVLLSLGLATAAFAQPAGSAATPAATPSKATAATTAGKAAAPAAAAATPPATTNPSGTATTNKPAATAPAAQPTATKPAATAPATQPTAAKPAPATQPTTPPGTAPGMAGTTPAGPVGAVPPTPSTNIDPSSVKPESMPTSVRLRRLEQRVQALKERAWRAKARVGMLKESVLGGGVGALAAISHKNNMGASYRLIKLVYSLDGVQVFARTDEAAESLYKTSTLEIFTGPISPGSHTLSVVAVYRGHGYGVFKYLDEFVVQARGTHTFTAGEGKTAKVDVSGYEKGGPTTPFDKRPAVDFKVTLLNPEKEKPADGSKPTDVTPAGSKAPAAPPAAPATPAATPAASTPAAAPATAPATTTPPAATPGK